MSNLEKWHTASYGKAIWCLALPDAMALHEGRHGPTLSLASMLHEERQALGGPKKWTAKATPSDQARSADKAGAPSSRWDRHS